jgi:hypothetical protein
MRLPSREILPVDRLKRQEAQRSPQEDDQDCYEIRIVWATGRHFAVSVMA